MKKICIKKSYIKLSAILVVMAVINICFFVIRSDSFEYSDEDLRLLEKYKEKKLIALTFDDGPSKYTSDLLDILKRENVKVTFFVLGQNIDKNKSALIREKEEGHLICIHSYEHVFFTKVSEQKVREQIETTRNMLINTIDLCPSYIRVPYGIINKKVKNILKDYSLENVLWTVDSLDWSYKNTQKTFEHVVNTTTGNDIILMHDILKTSINAAEKIIKYYKEQGYEFVTVYDFYRISKMK